VGRAHHILSLAALNAILESFWQRTGCLKYVATVEKVVGVAHPIFNNSAGGAHLPIFFSGTLEFSGEVD
jgi:hypothetical protein